MRVILIALCLAACSLAAPPADQPRPVPRPVEMPAPADMRGEWRLTAMNGRPAPSAADPDDAHHPITMSVGDFTFRARSQCVPFWRRYERQGDRLVVTMANPGAMCARGLSDWEREFDRTLSAVNTAERRGETLRLTGPGASLDFESAPPLPKESINGRWRLQSFHGAPPPAGEGPIELTISDGRIEVNACVFSGWRYRQDGPVLEVTPEGGAVCERTTTPFEQRFGAFMDRVMRATIIEDGSLILDSPLEQVEFDRIR
ncbi:META domain-containing protein [Brevundimonas sp.]|uniref:META domain-containing protein n=1 Tax=Brevundimonas sp. TaxID=1871086 RepID=UPI002D783C68|nr:META domain-containing protein [Brevundimonas sp.]